MPSLRPSETRRGRAWLTNFADMERPAAQLLLDSLQVASPAEVHHGLKSRIEALAPKVGGQTGVLIPAAVYRRHRYVIGGIGPWYQVRRMVAAGPARRLHHLPSRSAYSFDAGQRGSGRE